MKSNELRGTGDVFRFTLIQTLKSKAYIVSLVLLLAISLLTAPIMQIIRGGAAGLVDDLFRRKTFGTYLGRGADRIYAEDPSYPFKYFFLRYSQRSANENQSVRTLRAYALEVLEHLLYALDKHPLEIRLVLPFQRDLPAADYIYFFFCIQHLIISF